jgi:hypothetical protein
VSCNIARERELFAYAIMSNLHHNDSKKRVLPSSITSPETSHVSRKGKIKTGITSQCADRDPEKVTLSKSQLEVLNAILERKSVFFTGAAGDDDEINCPFHIFDISSRPETKNVLLIRHWEKFHSSCSSRRSQ